MQNKYKFSIKSHLLLPLLSRKQDRYPRVGVRYLLLILNVCTAMLWAQNPQTTWELKTDESSATKNYVARESIKLQSNGTTGFSFKATTGKTFSAKIDAGLLFPPTTNTYATAAGTITTDPTKGGVVGSIPGSASVSPSGAANYQIPIEVPVGVNGMQPQISVAYNSQGGFGALGTGWDISGLSSITRGPKCYYFDGQNNTLKFDNTVTNADALYLDGQRLILLSGTPFTSGATYATEVENYARIVYNGSGFIVTTKDGKTMEYGNSANSLQTNTLDPTDGLVLAWKLNKVTDTYGNFMTYTYSSRAQYLDKIEYADQSVEFSYKQEMDYQKQKFLNSFLILQRKLLSTITTKSGTTTLKTFGFNYKSSADNRLSSVTETASDGTMVNSTAINWGEESSGITSQTVAVNNEDKYLGDNGGSIYSGDVNNDGYEDRIEFWAGSSSQQGHILVRLFNPTTNMYNTSSNNAIAYFDYYDPDLYKSQIVVNDIDNDKQNEIVLLNGGKLFTYRFNNNLISLVNTFTIDNNVYYNKNRNIKMISGDLNHDNYNDIIIAFDNHEGEGKVYHPGYILYKGGSAGLSYFKSWFFGDNNPLFNNLWTTNNQLGDFNADGLIDIMGLNPNSTGGSVWDKKSDGDDYPIRYVMCGTYGQFNKNDINYRTCDFNGDGQSDILSQSSSDYTWKLLENSGDYYNIPSVIKQPIHTACKIYAGERDQSYVLDYNGDGLPDFVLGDETFSGDNQFVNTTWYFYKNVGGNLTLDATKISNSRIDKMYGLITDINGDGVADLVIPTTTNHTYTETICPDKGTTQPMQTKAGVQSIIKPTDCYPVTSSYTTYEYTAFTMPNATRRNQVTSITNGMGLTDSFTYSHFSDYDQTAETNASIRNVKSPMTIVSSHTDAAGSITNYKYSKPLMHTDGKGFLGFMTVVESNMNKNREITTEYEVNTTYFNVSLKSQTVTNYNAQTVASPALIKKISTSSQTNDVIDDVNRIPQGATGPKRYIPIVSTQTTIDEFKETQQIATFDYSLYPNSVTQTTTYGYKNKVDIDLTSKIETTFTGPTGVTPYLPASVTTTRTQGGLSDTRVTSHTYEYYTTVTTDPKKYQVTKSTEITDPSNTSFKTSAEYSNPDTWGHMQTITVTAKNQKGADESRSSSVTYTPSGRFIASKTNSALNESTTYNWDETLGLLTSETSNVGGTDKTTSYKYNSFGQLVETTYPDGMRKASVLQWNGDATAKYYVYSETSGNSPVWTYYDYLGREVRKEAKGLNGNIIRVFTTYRTDGKVDKVSDPTFNTTFSPTTDPCTAYGYNADYGYPESVTTPVGTTSTVYDKLTATVTSPEGTSVTVTNAAGQTLTSTVNSKTVTYTYYPTGLTHTSTPTGGQALTMEYNLQGKRTSLIDPDGGTIETVYDGFGELATEKQKIRNNTDYITTTNTYDANGLLLNINRNGEVTTNTYDTNIKTRVNVVELKDKNNQVQNKQTFGFDEFNRVTCVTEDIINKNGVKRTYVTGKEYDVFGRIKKEVYPSSYYTVNSYDKYSNLTEVKDKNNRSIWKANIENALGQATSIFKGSVGGVGGIETKYEYDPINHLKTSIKATAAEKIIDYTYGYDSKNNLSWRKDNRTTQQEDLGYDELNRLTSWKVTRAGVQTPYGIVYDPANPANIQTKSGIETDPDHLLTMYYGGKNPNGSTTGRPDGSLIGPHALSTISGVPASPFPQADLTVTYTDFKKIATLHEGTNDYELTYGVDDQRRMSEYKVGGVTKLTRYYVGNYEEEIGDDGKLRKIHYLSGAIFIQHEGAADSLLYTYSDAQGSLVALTDVDGNLVRRYAYDPWGARRDADNWNTKDNCVHLIVSRGYTGHEHLDAFGIINMNGRVYDPLTASFFSPDPYLQAPGDWVNYNRYAYCSGNPFRYTDPSGNLQLGPFYASLNIGWSKSGGLSFGISAGVGLEGTLYAGFSIGYGCKNGNFTFCVNAGAGGAYVYGGYDTKGGWIGGTGYAIQPFAIWSPVSISSNMLSESFDYSQNGGWSYNACGFNSDGDFNPSIGVSLTASWGSEMKTQELEENQDARSQEINSQTYSDNEKFPFPNDNMLQDFIYNYIPKNEYNIEGFTAYKNINQERAAQKNGMYTDGDGWICKSNSKRIYGVTIKHNNGLSKPSYMIYLSRNPNFSQFIGTVNHEVTHAYIYFNNLTKNMSKDQEDAFHESNAYRVGQGFVPDKYFRMYPNGIVVPPNLISLPNSGPYIYRTW